MFVLFQVIALFLYVIFLYNNHEPLLILLGSGGMLICYVLIYGLGQICIHLEELRKK